MRKKVCPVCGALFEPKTYWQKFDKPYCRKKKYQLDHPKPKKEKEFKPDPGVQFLGRFCEVCGEPLMGRDHRSDNKKHCGLKCRQSAYRHRRSGGLVFTLKSDQMSVLGLNVV